MFLFLYTSPPDCNAYVPVPLPPSPSVSKQLEYVQSSAPPSPSSPVSMWENEHVLLPSGHHRSYAHTHSWRCNLSECLFPDNNKIWSSARTNLSLSTYIILYKTIYNYYSDTIKSKCNTFLKLPNMCQSNHIEKHKLTLFQFIGTKHSHELIFY